MPDVVVEKQTTLDLLDLKTPALSATSDIPIVETKPDASPPKEEKKEETAPPAEEKEPAAEAKPEESAPSETPDDAAAEPEPKKAKGVQKRIDELTRQREDERRRAEAAEARLDRALAALEKGTGVPAKDSKQAIETEDPEPQKPVKDANDPESYDRALEEYVTARSSWIARREVKASLAEEEKKRQDEETAKQYKSLQESYKSKVEKVKEKYPDYETVAESPDVQVSMPMANAIFHSDEGPEIAYYLGKNPAEAERISKLVPQLQLVELGKIVARLNMPVATKPVSAAPTPGKPIKASSETTLSPEEESMEAYATRRKKELAERNRPGVRH
jgi:hypothetical protein